MTTLDMVLSDVLPHASQTGCRFAPRLSFLLYKMRKVLYLHQEILVRMKKTKGVHG